MVIWVSVVLGRAVWPVCAGNAHVPCVCVQGCEQCAVVLLVACPARLAACAPACVLCGALWHSSFGPLVAFWCIWRRPAVHAGGT